MEPEAARTLFAAQNMVNKLIVLARSRCSFLAGKEKRRRLLWEQYLFSLVLAGRFWLHKTW